MHRALLICFAILLACRLSSLQAEDQPRLPGTEPLTMEGDIAAQMVEAVDKFLLRKLDESAARRKEQMRLDYSSLEQFEQSLAPHRERLAKMLGIVDERVEFESLELLSTTDRPAKVGEGSNYEILAVRWPVVRDVYAEGLLLRPKGRSPWSMPDIVAIPSADQSPEQICGLADGVPLDWQYARKLASVGCRVLVPTIINREMAPRHPPERKTGANLTNREFLYRPGFEMGRHLIGYEVQKVLAAVDWFKKQPSENGKIGVFGYADGGLIALYAKAIDPRIDAACVSGYFGERKEIWNEPIDRNVFGLLAHYGDAEIGLLASRGLLVIENSSVERRYLPSEGGAPARIGNPADPSGEHNRLQAYLKPLREAKLDEVDGKRAFDVHYNWSLQSGLVSQFGSEGSLNTLLRTLTSRKNDRKFTNVQPTLHKNVDIAARHARQMVEIERDTQQLLAESPYVRAEFMKKLDTSSVVAYQKSVEEYREFFATQVIGRFDDPLLEPKPRSRKAYETDKWTGYEVVLDVFPEVFAYGLLLLPKDLKEGERRPVVVCQHGLEGRPQDVIGEQKIEAYGAFAARLAERGFITFAPQNLYIGKDKFRTLQRKANPLGKTLFSVIVPQHQQICNWLGSLPMVDKDRIAFYGLSYGGKSAMRIPPLVPDYCLSICSADFNDWVWKNASTRAPYSYVWTGEYEIYEWNLGHTFNYAEMAALIAPRPFMVERGMFDGVAPDEAVAYEFAKVRHLYEGRLKLQDRCEIEFFPGPHKINGVGTFAFLHKHLNWPEPAAP